MDLLALTIFDYITISTVALSMLFAFIRGFINSFFSLTGWIVSFILTYVLFPYIQPVLENKIENKVVVLIAGHIGLLLLLLVVFAILNCILAILFRGVTKGGIDRVLGAVFGLFRGILIISFFYLCFVIGAALIFGDSSKNEDKFAPEFIKTSQTYPLIKQGKDLLIDILPTHLNEHIEHAYEAVSKKNIDERFLRYMISRLEGHATKNELQKFDDEKAIKTLTQSEEIIELDYLKSLLKAYNNKDISKNKIKKNDLKRSNELIVEKEKELRQTDK